MKLKTKFSLIELIFISLATIPVTFKISMGSVAILPQEIILPMILILFYSKQKRINYVKRNSLPFVFLQAALLIILFSTIISLFRIFDPLGALRVFKYSLYIVSIITVINHLKFKERHFNIILNLGLLVVLYSLITFVIKKYKSPYEWKGFISLATWDPNYMPTGLSNTAFSLLDYTFSSISLNHGIYGTYLVLLIMLAFLKLTRTKYKKGKLVLIFSTINLLMISSREAWVLLFITIIVSVFLYFTIKGKINFKIFVSIALFVSLFVLGIIIYQPEIVIFNKIRYMISGIQENGLDGNLKTRINTWALSVLSLYDNPITFFTGIGNNKSLYDELLNEQYINRNFTGGYIAVPESYIINFLTFGGVGSLIFSLMFFFDLVIYVIKSKLIFNLNGILLLSFIVGLFMSNLIGVSILGELLLTQFGISYAYLTYED